MFNGLSTNELFNGSLIGRDVSQIVATLAEQETPILDWLGNSPVFATNLKHEYVEDNNLPRYITASTVINSAVAVTVFQVNGFGNALSVGQLLDNESANPETMQVASIVGANTIAVTRNYDGVAVGSLAPGGQLYVREPLGLPGSDHSGADTRKLGTLRANTVGYYRYELAADQTSQAIRAASPGDTWENRVQKGLRAWLANLENAVVRGRLNAADSLGNSSGASTYRSMLGLRPQITSVASVITAASFVANPDVYIAPMWQAVFHNGGSVNEEWGIIAGATFFGALSNINDTKFQDSNTSELYQRRLSTYRGPFGEAAVFGSRSLPDNELILVPRNRVFVPPMQGRSVFYDPMAHTGDNQKALIVGEYTLEAHHCEAMARLIGQ